MRLSRVIATISLVAGTGVAVVLSWPQDSRGTPGPRPVETSQPIASTSADCSPHHAAAHDRAAAADEIAQVLTEEHGAALRLTELCEATHVATKSGRWSEDRKSTRLNSSHSQISYAVFCLKKKKKQQ